MGSRSRARRVVAALGFAGLLCAVLGVIMIVMVPSIIKQQVLKVGERPGRGSVHAVPSGAGGRWAPRRAGCPGPGPLSTGETRGHEEGPLATFPGTSPTQDAG